MDLSRRLTQKQQIIPSFPEFTSDFFTQDVRPRPVEFVWGPVCIPVLHLIARTITITFSVWNIITIPRTLRMPSGIRLSVGIPTEQVVFRVFLLPTEKWIRDSTG